MCYDLIENTKSELNYALCRGDHEHAQKLIDRLNALELIRQRKYKVNSYDFPQLLCFTKQRPFEPELLTWGLIPSDIKTWAEAKERRTGNFNAKAETMFELKSFQKSAKDKRCLVYVDGFYEYHDQNGIKYPHKISLKTDEVMVMAGIWDQWANPDTGEIMKTVAIVTVEPPKEHIMSKIHNKPMWSKTPRMPLILNKEKQDEWLSAEIKTFGDVKEFLKQAVPFPADQLTAHTVKKLRGKGVLGNVPEVFEKEVYPELLLRV